MKTDRRIALIMELSILGIFLAVLLGSWLTARPQDLSALRQQVRDNQHEVQDYKSQVHDRFDAQERHMDASDARLAAQDERVRGLEESRWWLQGGVGAAILLQSFGLLRSFRKEQR